MRYVSEKFQGLKREFRKIVAGAIRSGLGYPPVESRHPHYDQLKEITINNPSF